MSGRLVFGRRAGSERGSVLVLTTVMLTSLLGMTMIVFDLGALRGNVRTDQSIADLGALAAGPGLGANNPTAACQAAANYISTNAKLDSPINCSGMGTTVCSGGSGQATPSTSVGKYTISIHYPVPDTEIADPNIVGGVRLNDSTQCQRMRVIITSTDATLFAQMIGTTSLSATRSATVRASAVGPRKTPALWLLDPRGCTSLAVSGAETVVKVGTPAVPGVLTVDSDGSDPSCTGKQETISAPTGALSAEPTSGADPGLINLRALPVTEPLCVTPACDPSDVSGLRLLPQPIGVTARATRARVDDVYNCQSVYPDYHRIPLVSNCDPSSTPPYINNLKTAVGPSGTPAGYSRWTDFYSCNAPSGTPPLSGNWHVDCPGGLSIGNGTNVEFKDGNVVFDGGFSMTGGTLQFNTNNSTATLPASCVPPLVVVPCIGSASAAASFVYLRSGDINVTGGVLTARHTMAYLASGYVKVNSSPPTWLGPTEGPFDFLALWSDMPAGSNSTGKFAMAGGLGVKLAGVFFTPEAAAFSLTGGGVWGQQNAQFISYQLKVSGGAKLTMAPNPTDAVKVQSMAGRLIR